MKKPAVVDSRQFFRTHWRLWLLLGCVREPVRYQLLYRLYRSVVNALIILFYPGTVLIALYNSGNVNDLLQMLPICAAALACSAKYISYYRRLNLVWQVEQIFNALDEKILLEEDQEFFAGIHRGTNLILNTLCGICVFLFAITVMAFADSLENRDLAFAMELPFDWRAWTAAYVGAVALELLLLACDLVQSLANYSFPAVALTNHTRLLGARLSRIGHTDKDVQANIQELQQCIIDHQRLYGLQEIIEEIISMSVFIQYAVTAFQDCFTLITFIFYTNTVSDKVLYLTYLLALQLQIFPLCYYGAACAQSMDDLQREIYASNWIEQDQVYRRLVIILSQRSLKSTTVYVAISAKDTFLVHPGVKVAKHDFDIVAGAALISALQVLVEDIFGHVVLLFGRSVSANQRYVEELSDRHSSTGVSDSTRRRSFSPTTNPTPK